MIPQVLSHKCSCHIAKPSSSRLLTLLLHSHYYRHATVIVILITNNCCHYFLCQILASSGIWCVFYFLGAIFFCSFYLLNLVLAVVALSYELEIKSVSKEVGNCIWYRIDTRTGSCSFQAQFRLIISWKFRTVPNYEIQLKCSPIVTVFFFYLPIRSTRQIE